MTFKELRKIVTRNAQWEAYRTDHGIASASDLSKAELEEIAHAFGIDTAADAPTPAPAKPEPKAETKAETTGPDPLAPLRPVLSPDMLAPVDKAIAAIVADLATARKAADTAKKAAAFQPVASSGTGKAPVTVNGGTSQGPRPFSDVIGGRKHSFDVETFTGADRVPALDGDYVWPDRTPYIVKALEGPEFARRHVMLFGPRGTGKTTFAEQYAANTGRPCFLVPFDADVNFDRLFGFPAPEGDGMEWFPGPLLVAMQTPNAVIALEEIGTARAELATGPLQTLLQSGKVELARGLVATVAPGVRFIATNNNNGAELSPGGYHGLRPMNDALRDRFAVMAEIPYLTPAREAAALAKRTGAALDLCRAVADFAALTRKADADMDATIGFRRMLAFVDMLQVFPDDARHVFDMTVREGFGEDDRAALDQLAAAELDHARLARLAKGEADPAPDAGDDDARGTVEAFAAERYGFSKVDPTASSY